MSAAPHFPIWLRLVAHRRRFDAAVHSPGVKMKALLISALIAAVAGGAQAQTACRQEGAFTNCNDGRVASRSQKIGQFRDTDYNNGMRSTSQQVGSQTSTNYSNGVNATSQQTGQNWSTHYSNGTNSTTQRIGNSTYTHYSDGRTVTCQYVGDHSYCN
jgi:hypothetical protein